MKLFTIALILLFSLSAQGQEFSTIKIELETKGASVFLDNVQIKENNFSKLLTVASGSHSVQAKMDGYFPYLLKFSLKKGESKVIAVSLEKDTRAEISFSSALSGISGRINNDLNIDIPSIQKLYNGTYYLSFSKPGFLPAEKRVIFMDEIKYEIKIDLKQELPLIDKSLVNIGRYYKSPVGPSDFNKPEVITKDLNFLSGLVGGIAGFALGFGVGYAIGGEESSILALPLCAVGIGAGGAWGFIKHKKPSKENIYYNKNTVPGLVKSKNSEIEMYNRETERLIEQKQRLMSQEKYIENAISVNQK